MQTREIPITNPLGLHARACARIVQVASRFRCKVSLANGVRRASAHSIVAVMLLAGAVGTTIIVETDGPDEIAAMVAIVSLIRDGLERRQ
ncbi:MAG TPA: HPr family phosphocarrier protein [Casimicrobiaceae bacterium]|nr:HPr family phosphocarrier protein [Casimicrobiaceae bacterium]